MILIVEDRQFQALCRVLEREDLLEDPRCANLLTRIAHAKELLSLLAEEVEKWPTAELIERARKFGAPLSNANSIKDFLEDPQVAVNRTVFETEHPTAGTLRLLRHPVRFQTTPASVRHPAPGLGEHTDEILEKAGYSPPEIDRLRESGAIA